MAQILALLQQLLGLVSGVGPKLQQILGKLAELAADSIDLVDAIVTAVYVPLDRALDQAVAALRKDITGSETPGAPTTTDIHGDTQTIINVVGGDPGTLANIDQWIRMMRDTVPVSGGASFWHRFGSIVEISESGWVDFDEADGIQIVISSFPAGATCENAGAFKRFPHLGWCLPGISATQQFGDVHYLGPETQGIAFDELRRATGAYFFLRRGYVLTITTWWVGIAD